MKAKLVTIAKALLYPLFYLLCLVIGVIATFPWDQVKHRIEAEFAKSQSAKGAGAWKLEIGELDGYWLSGVEFRNAKITIPPDEQAASSSVGSPPRSAKARSGDDEGDDGPDEAPAAKEPQGPPSSIVLLQEGHARVRLLPLLIGRVRVDFSLSAFNGELHGTVPVGGGDFSLDIENVDLSQVAPLKNLVTLPVKGIANGRMNLSAPDGKFSKASGALELTMANIELGDGKAKLLGKMALPPAMLGTFEIGATAKDGVLTIDKFDATGRDAEVHGSGTVRLRQPWDMSVADVYLRFGFSDSYRATDDKTKALLGEPGQDTFPPLLEQDRKIKRAKRSDGLYGFRIHGRLRALKFDPTTADGPKPAKSGPAAAGNASDDEPEDTRGAGFSNAAKRRIRKPETGAAPTVKAPVGRQERASTPPPPPEPVVREPPTPRFEPPPPPPPAPLPPEPIAEEPGPEAPAEQVEVIENDAPPPDHGSAVH